MKLIRFSHDRCNEWDCVEYLLAPDTMGRSEIREAAHEVMAEMIEQAKKLAVTKPEDAPPQAWHPPYDEFPDKTVREVKEIQRERQAARRAWETEHSDWKKSFEQRMRERGFVALWQDEAEDYLDEIALSWGHNHGLDLRYGSHVKSDDDL